MKKLLLLLILLNFLLCEESFADCPAINTITQNPEHPNSWQAPGYEGFSSETEKVPR